MRLVFENDHTPLVGRFRDVIVQDPTADKLWLYDATGTVVSLNTAGRGIFTFPEVADFPAIGYENTLYVALDAGSVYYWTGSAYDYAGSAAAVLSVNGKNGEVVLDADDLDEGSTHRFLTNAERTKLSGIETGADVTDLQNVAAVMHSATTKSTPVDADTFALVDSEDSNTLKKPSWANIKAAIKSYFDTLYAAISHTHTSSQVGLGNVPNVDATQRSNHTGTQTASTISDFNTQVRISRLDQMAVPTASVNLNSQKITNLLDPTSAQDAATKAYVDSVGGGGGGSDDQTAAEVPFTPAGNISATNTQDAVEELDAEKAADSSVVHLTGNESISGNKTFTGDVDINGLTANNGGFAIGEASSIPNTSLGGMDAPFGTIAGNDAVMRIITWHGIQQYVSKRGPADWYISHTDGSNETNALSVAYNLINVHNLPVINVANPSSAQDAATKNYVDKLKRVVQIQATDPNGDALTTGDGKAYFTVPSELNGYNLVDADASVTTVSSSGTPTIQIANVTQAVDMLTTKITIDAGENTSYTAATAPVIDAANDDVATGDILRVDIDVAGTGAKGLTVILSFQLP